MTGGVGPIIRKTPQNGTEEGRSKCEECGQKASIPRSTGQPVVEQGRGKVKTTERREKVKPDKRGRKKKEGRTHCDAIKDKGQTSVKERKSGDRALGRSAHGIRSG